jgi:hypothetical protein
MALSIKRSILLDTSWFSFFSTKLLATVALSRGTDFTEQPRFSESRREGGFSPVNLPNFSKIHTRNNNHFFRKQRDYNYIHVRTARYIELGEGEEEFSHEQIRPPCSGGAGLTRPTVPDSETSRAGIPEVIKDNQYASERDLLVDLVKLGLDDLPIILNHHGFPICRGMAGDEHVGVVGRIIDRFEECMNGRPIKCRTEVNVYVNESSY